MSFVYLAVVAALAAIETTAQKPQPGKGPTIVEVRIVVDSRASLEDQCKAGKFAAVDVLVDSDEKVKEPYHCPPGGKLLEHKIAHADKRTLVRLSYANQDTVRWQSDREFSIAKIGLRDVPKVKEGVPTTPFGKLGVLPTKSSKSITSGPITSKASVGYQYKIYLTIGNRPIDPDVWCDP